MKRRRKKDGPAAKQSRSYLTAAASLSQERSVLVETPLARFIRAQSKIDKLREKVLPA
jgi:hypothetical protein